MTAEEFVFDVLGCDPEKRLRYFAIRTPGDIEDLRHMLEILLDMGFKLPHGFSGWMVLHGERYQAEAHAKHPYYSVNREYEVMSGNASVCNICQRVISYEEFLNLIKEDEAPDMSGAVDDILSLIKGDG